MEPSRSSLVSPVHTAMHLSSSSLNASLAPSPSSNNAATLERLSPSSPLVVTNNKHLSRLVVTNNNASRFSTTSRPTTLPPPSPPSASTSSRPFFHCSDLAAIATTDSVLSAFEFSPGGDGELVERDHARTEEREEGHPSHVDQRDTKQRSRSGGGRSVCERGGGERHGEGEQGRSAAEVRREEVALITEERRFAVGARSNGKWAPNASREENEEVQ
ncbi:hypothetical protein Scep_011630 [Stephania cephalantha]|uniref:Uncharacterized protein n=1 Tax=Stephania cephalantha TaxID=152367 RepID=A0AAP0JDE0_9MAGN